MSIRIYVLNFYAAPLTAAKLNKLFDFTPLSAHTENENNNNTKKTLPHKYRCCLVGRLFYLLRIQESSHYSVYITANSSGCPHSFKCSAQTAQILFYWGCTLLWWCGANMVWGATKQPTNMRPLWWSVE